jgi:dienelactone hydrolase
MLPSIRGQAKPPAPPRQRSGAGGFACPPILLAALALTATAADKPATRDAKFYSEGVQCAATIFLPDALNGDQKVAAVVLAPAWGETAAALEPYARGLAKAGVAAMTIDYRGWGKSGGYIYLAENLRYDDRLRFSQHTAKVRLRRKRLIPQDQVLDIRNAISYLQGEPNIDRARIGVWGADMAGGHAIVVAATDPRVKAVVAQTPRIEGQDVEKKAVKPGPDAVKLARTGEAPAPAAAGLMAAVETRLALAEYHPFWYVDQIPQTTAVLFVVAEKDAKVDNEVNAIAASKRLKGQTRVTAVPGAAHTLSGAAQESAAKPAAEWFAKYL